MKVTQPEAIDVINVPFFSDAFLAISNGNTEHAAAHHTRWLRSIAAGFSCASKIYSC
jgi:hypothetical protein